MKQTTVPGPQPPIRSKAWFSTRQQMKVMADAESRVLIRQSAKALPRLASTHTTTNASPSAVASAKERQMQTRNDLAEMVPGIIWTDRPLPLAKVNFTPGRARHTEQGGPVFLCAFRENFSTHYRYATRNLRGDMRCARIAEVRSCKEPRVATRRRVGANGMLTISCKIHDTEIPPQTPRMHLRARTHRGF